MYGTVLVRVPRSILQHYYITKRRKIRLGLETLARTELEGKQKIPTTKNYSFFRAQFQSTSA